MGHPLKSRMRSALEQEVTRVTEVTEATTLTVYQPVVHATVGAAGNYNLTLPSVVEAAGLIFSVHATVNSNAITLQDQDDSYDWDGDYTLDTDNDAIALYSDGRTWWVIESRIT